MASQPNSERTVRCVIYTRSATTTSQTPTDERGSILAQKHQCEEFARKNGWIVAAHYSDIKRPGTDIARCPALQSLIASAEKNPPQFGLLLVADSSRLSRRLEAILAISRSLKGQGITIHFVNEGLCSGDSHFRQSVILHGMMDETYGTALGERIREGMRASNRKFHGATSRTDRRRAKKLAKN